MENKLSNSMPQALDTNELENISGGRIVHSKDKEEKDIYYVLPDYTLNTPYGPMGTVQLKKHGEFSGPYSTKEEAIEEAKKCGCTSTDVVDIPLEKVMGIKKWMKYTPKN